MWALLEGLGWNVLALATWADVVFSSWYQDWSKASFSAIVAIVCIYFAKQADTKASMYKFEEEHRAYMENMHAELGTEPCPPYQPFGVESDYKAN
jgi:hypothetical protein